MEIVFNFIAFSAHNKKHTIPLTACSDRSRLYGYSSAGLMMPAVFGDSLIIIATHEKVNEKQVEY